MPQVFDAKKKGEGRRRGGRYSPVFEELSKKRDSAVWSAFAVTPPNLRFETQEPDEKIILLLRQHPVVNLGWIVVAVGMALMPAFWEYLPFSWLPVRFQLATAVLWYLLVLAYVLEKFLNWYFNVYIVTDERVVDIDFHGLIHRNLAVTQIANVQDVNFVQTGGMAAIFNYGDVFIQTAAEQREFDFLRVPNPGRVVEILYMLQQEEQQEELEGRLK
ncbi:PH domain-containing protein [Candidatus Chazhemtobacterium aquaticus]|uniref:YdbS-like PH domain-containing protein n=1 Tax=Candidatus Chazhemtobacterium aquaticus TaxID=2715735 RepID=A0A857NFZ5_9BACT|nr:PH domain-containing protein [Candidatus Chazhemtobacterium aquaticus]QHO63178.1 hypothetical protein MICH65_0197 [Candidatus Chazhemtobacterium aquaticus]